MKAIDDVHGPWCASQGHRGSATAMGSTMKALGKEEARAPPFAPALSRGRHLGGARQTEQARPTVSRTVLARNIQHGLAYEQCLACLTPVIKVSLSLPRELATWRYAVPSEEEVLARAALHTSTHTSTDNPVARRTALPLTVLPGSAKRYMAVDL